MLNRNASHTIKQELRAILLFIGGIWAVFFLTLAVPSLALESYGVVPRTLYGLVGIAAMPFLHDNFYHLLSNTIPLFILLALLAGSNARSWLIVTYVVLLSGTLLWLAGQHATHVGASGLIFGLIAFLIVAGFLEKRIVPLCVSLVVGFFYGGTLLWGIFPHMDSEPNVSWDGHLWGAVAGAMVAFALTSPKRTWIGSRRSSEKRVQ